MVKVCIKTTPEGSYNGQRGPGFYMDGFLKENLDICCRSIVKDMDFVFLVTGSGMVRVGKSVFTTQMGKYITETVNKIHGLNNTFDENNIVFKSEELIKTALKLKPYSVLVLDEGDDLTEHYMSKLTRTLRRFFRKCGQLNLFIFLLIPDFFELPTSIALTRSVALIDVNFYGEFERGLFRFYDFDKKRQLYIQGKKFRNYKCVKANFPGRFPHYYGIDEKKYREKKRKDLEDDDKELLPEEKTLHKLMCVFANIDRLRAEKKLDINRIELANLFNLSQTQMYSWRKKINEDPEKYVLKKRNRYI